ncbi:MAG: membrane protein insertion efficiency factor YidD [Defluviitaleaceae bacterium]|nr:membrane protein insertion efficiency factor YidD [Defluviitaleaceae bacterium]
MKKLLLAALRFYKRFISPALGPRCRFYPSCSEYMYEAVQRYGAAYGFWLGIKRLVRCQPFCKGGYDPVP